MKGTLAVRPKAATGAPPADELAVSAADTTGQGAPPCPCGRRAGGPRRPHDREARDERLHDQSELYATAGQVTLQLLNTSPAPQGIALKSHGVDAAGPVVSTGGVSELTITLRQGGYTYYSTAGEAEGRLVVS